MSETTSINSYYQAGGTLSASAPTYVPRAADESFFQLLSARQLCYVLTARQLGKSSMMVRVSERLKRQGISTAIVDLSARGVQEITISEWYLGVVNNTAQQLNLSIDLPEWWEERKKFSHVERFNMFCHDILLAEGRPPTIIFIDEVDSTIKLPFGSDFLAAIRAMYNLRATDERYEGLTFALIGSATPTDLISDTARTPFNVGREIKLLELNLTEAQPLEAGLEKLFPGRGGELLRYIFELTHGHPYLTQKLCVEISEEPGKEWTHDEVDGLVHKLFVLEESRKDSNLQFVRRSIIEITSREEVLELYRTVYQGARVQEDERSPIQQRLRLIGLVTSGDGILQVSNEIYRRVFTEEWIDSMLQSTSSANAKDAAAVSSTSKPNYALIAAIFAALTLMVMVAIAIYLGLQPR